MSDAASSKNLINVMRLTLSFFFVVVVVVVVLFFLYKFKLYEKKIFSLSCDKLEYVVINGDIEGKINFDRT